MMNTETLGRASSPPLIMLHGWGQSLTQLKPLAELLSSRYYIHLIDLPGFGLSQPPTNVWGTMDYAKQLLTYMDENRISKASFLGHSFGGKVSLQIAATHPEKVENLILIAASGMRKKRTFFNQCYFKAIGWTGKVIKAIDRVCHTSLFANTFIPRFGSADYKNSGSMRPILVRTVNEDFSDQFPQITAKTLLIWGKDDTETPYEIGQRLHEKIPHSQLLIFPHKGHEPFQGVGAHLCAYHILRFHTEVQ